MPEEQPPATPVRVALSNDYEIVLLGLAAMLARHPDQVQVVGITSTSRMPHPADVILYDTFGRLPEEDLKLRRVISENEGKVVVYSFDDYPEEVARRLGAAGYLHKGVSSAELVAAIVAIHDGTDPTTDVGTGSAADAPGDAPADVEDSVSTWPGQVYGLSEREAEMISFITRGLSNEEIARRAFLSINTVKTYIRTAYRKIGVSSRAQAVAWGYEHGFVSTSDVGP
jgi:DNA-binding NarL/FixJ family response regulator